MTTARLLGTAWTADHRGPSDGGPRWSAVLTSAMRRARDRHYAEAREVCYALAGGRCKVQVSDLCSRQCEQVHHIAGRGGDDPHRQENLLATCASCHVWIHAHPAAARERGWIVRRR